MVGFIDESVTPHSFAQDTAELLDSPLLSVESSRHGPVAFYDNTCVNEAVSAHFLETSPVVDTTCGE
ncbi:MAG: alpha/beta hydrolase [Nitrosopumilus sp.]|nr:alpha/beta hydrolase [Nitrosopumilus sp.]